MITNWLSENPDTQFEIYSAFPVNNPNSLCMEWNPFTVLEVGTGACVNDLGFAAGFKYYPCAYANAAYPPLASVQADVCNFYTNIKPWQDLGITRIWLDYSNHYWTEFEEFPYCPLYAPAVNEPHFLGAEAFPMNESDPNNIEIDMGRAVHCPAIMFPGHIAGRDPDRSWNVAADASSTELMVVVDPDEEYFVMDDMFGVLAWTQRGFVLGAQSSENALLPPQFTEFMKRVYDFGVLENRRDFNGDGDIDSDDVSDFNAAYALYAGKSNCNWVHGDMNQDHVVNPQDALLFNTWHTIITTKVAVNLGNANPDNALTD